MDTKGLGEYYHAQSESSEKSLDRRQRRELHEQFEAGTSVWHQERQRNASNGEFDVSECIYNFGEGVMAPLAAAAEHPFLTAGAAGACMLLPPLIPAAAMAFGLYSTYQLGKGAFDASYYYYNGDWDKAEKAYRTLGEGAAGIAMTPQALLHGAQTAKGIRAMHVLGETSLSTADKSFIAGLAKRGSILDNIDDITSLYTSREGLSAAAAQLKPKYLAARINDLYNILKTSFEGGKTEVQRERKPFAETAEGRRRAALTHEEIEAEVKQLVKEAFDELGVPEDLRPPVEVFGKNNPPSEFGGAAEAFGGGYIPEKHKIYINEELYKMGAMDFPDINAHESFHASRAVLRQRIPADIKQKAAAEHLTSRILNGDKEKVIVLGEYGPDIAESPKLTPKIRKAFADFAKDKLYQMHSYSLKELEAMVRPIAQSDAEFLKGYSSVDEAVKALAKYAGGHNFRYKQALTRAAGFDTSNIDISRLTDLKPEEIEQAVKAFTEGIDVLEDNAAVFDSMNQYSFTPEEVQAVRIGSRTEIAKLQEQLAALRKKPGYDLAQEARLLDEIKRYELTAEYRTQGRRLYELSIEAHNNPDNVQAAEQLNAVQQELSAVQSEIDRILDLTHVHADESGNPVIEALDYTVHEIPAVYEPGMTADKIIAAPAASAAEHLGSSDDDKNEK